MQSFTLKGTGNLMSTLNMEINHLINQLTVFVNHQAQNSTILFLLLWLHLCPLSSFRGTHAKSLHRHYSLNSLSNFKIFLITRKLPVINYPVILLQCGHNDFQVWIHNTGQTPLTGHWCE